MNRRGFLAACLPLSACGASVEEEMAGREYTIQPSPIRTRHIVDKDLTNNIFDGQLQFPATQNQSDDVNNLDDYEENDWTPTLLFGGASTGITFSSRIGKYTKVGRLVVLSCYLTLTSKGSATGIATISGNSFSTGIGGAPGVSAVDFSNMTSTLVNFTARLASAATNVELLGATAAATGLSALTDAAFANNSSFGFVLAFNTST